MISNNDTYEHILEQFALISVDLVKKGLSTEEELLPVYDYILSELEIIALDAHEQKRSNINEISNVRSSF